MLSIKSAAKIYNLYIKSKGSIWRNVFTGTLSAVCEMRRDGQSCFLPFLKLADPLVPAWDDLSCPENKLKWLTSGYWGVKNMAIGQLSRVVYNYGASMGHQLTLTLIVLLNL